MIDAQIRRLVDGLKRKDRLGCVNLILVSDHGMADSPPGQQLVDLEKYVKDLDNSALVFYSPVTSIYTLHHLLVSGRKVELNATQLHSHSLNESSDYEEQLLNQTISQLDPNQGNITGDNETELLRLHAPLGVPQAAGNECER